MKLSDYPKDELNELLDAIVFVRIWDEDYPEQENDPNQHLAKWEGRLRELLDRPFSKRGFTKA